MSSKYFRLLQILRNIICECFPFLWIHRRIVRNLHHAVKISWNVQLYLKYRCHFLLQHCSGWKGKKRLSTLFKAWCTQQYSTVYLLRWWGWSSCPLSPWKASPSPWSVMGLLNLGQLTSSSHFPLPSRASQSTHNSCCFFARVSHSASMHSSSLYTFLFMAELSACKSEPVIPSNTVFTTELYMKWSQISHANGISPVWCWGSNSKTQQWCEQLQATLILWSSLEWWDFSPCVAFCFRFCQWRFSILLRFFAFF